MKAAQPCPAAPAPPSADRLADREEIPLTVPEPGSPFTHAAFARVISAYFRHGVDCLETRRVVFLEHHAARAQLPYGGVDVGNLPGDLGMLA